MSLSNDLGQGVELRARFLDIPPRLMDLEASIVFYEIDHEITPETANINVFDIEESRVGRHQWPMGLRRVFSALRWRRCVLDSTVITRRGVILLTRYLCNCCIPMHLELIYLRKDLVLTAKTSCGKSTIRQ
jgi:hypothetical protein